ncbi:MAG: sugar kinase [Thaumarchaeota archaeon]|jgi:rfaE bifunctional protein kinase chain/domain|nr:sugar kinase [Nitrososphaerota archaeon]
MEGLKRSRLVEILDSFKKLKGMVIGDYALDVYWYADMTRSELSRETPRYTRPVVRETYSPGASGNICCNVKALGLEDVFAVTVIGDDWRGRLLNEKLRENGVRLDFLIMSPERVTPTYVKPILCGWDSQQEDSRLDFINYSPLSSSLEEKIIENVKEAVEKVDLVIIEDQMSLNGVVTENVRSGLIQLAEKNPDRVFIADSRERIGFFRNMVLKPNRMEAVRAIRPSRNPLEVDMDELLHIGRELQEKAKRPVYITLSEKGCLIVTGSGSHHVPAAPTEPPIDPVGAGDTFISAVGAGLAGGADPVEAGIVASLAAGVILKKLNTTGTASPGEILAKFDEVSKGGEWP